MKKYTMNFIGIALLVVGLVLLLLTSVKTQFTTNKLQIFAVIMYLGLSIAASKHKEVVIDDCDIPNSKAKLARTEYHFIPLFLSLPLWVITLGVFPLSIIWRVEYFLIESDNEESYRKTKIPRKDYLRFKREAKQSADRQFIVEQYYSNGSGYTLLKIKMIIAFAFLLLYSACITPENITGMGIIVFIILIRIIRWIPQYIEKRKIHKAYKNLQL